MMRDYQTKDMTGADNVPAVELVCVSECVTPALGKGTWAVGDVVSDAGLVRILAGNPYFKKREVK